MKLGIMQPYFFPYIGYFQLMNAVDKYVIYNDVNYIKGGWINRNRILLNGNDFLLNIQLKGASPHKKINEISINDNRTSILKTITQAYRKAPYYDNTYPLLEEIINYKTDNLSDFLANSLKSLASYLNFNTEIILSSEIEKNNELKGQNKVLSICNILKASEYYNAIGGRELYSVEDFKDKGIDLYFLKTQPIEYQQFDNQFISNLSIIDVMMFNSYDGIKDLLCRFELV
ncbi:MAG: WbqC family protein [Dysgonomonas sp.]